MTIRDVAGSWRVSLTTKALIRYTRDTSGETLRCVCLTLYGQYHWPMTKRRIDDNFRGAAIFSQLTVGTSGLNRRAPARLMAAAHHWFIRLLWVDACVAPGCERGTRVGLRRRGYKKGLKGVGVGGSVCDWGDGGWLAWGLSSLIIWDRCIL